MKRKTHDIARNSSVPRLKSNGLIAIRKLQSQFNPVLLISRSSREVTVSSLHDSPYLLNRKTDEKQSNAKKVYHAHQNDEKKPKKRKKQAPENAMYCSYIRKKLFPYSISLSLFDFISQLKLNIFSQKKQ